MINDGSDCVVRVRGLEKSYGTVRALRGVTFSVRRGEVFGYLGPNGAGKTTTVNILSGLLERDGGDVEIAGFDVARDPVRVKRRIGVVPEESNLYPELSCCRNLEYLGQHCGLARPLRKARASAILVTFDLSDKAETSFRTLSRGMKRRLTLAAALVHAPGILFLDEPTSGLDVPGARALRSLIRRISREGTTVFLTTHNLNEAEGLCDRILILVKGVVAAEGTTREIEERAARAKVVSVVFSGEVGEAKLRASCPAVHLAARTADGWRLEAEDAHEATVQVVAFAERAGVRIEEMRTGAGSLEDAFVRLLDEQPGKRGGPA